MEATMVKFKTVDEYLNSVPASTRDILEKLREIILKSAPKAEEVISYNMPAIKLNGILVWYAAYKKHIGFYPLINEREIFKDELAGYNGGKATVQFPLAKPLPMALITKIIKHKVKENKEREKSKNPSQKKTPK